MTFILPEPEENDRFFYDAVKHGDITKIRDLINAGVSVNGSYLVSDITPLSLAINEGKIEVIKVLLDSGADPNKGISANSMFYAILKEDREIIHLLIKKSKTLKNKNNEFLAIAALHGDFESVKSLIQAGVDINDYDIIFDGTGEENEYTHPLLSAILEGHLEIFDYLLPLINLQSYTEIQIKALFSAAATDNLNALNILTKNEKKLEVRNDKGQTPLMIAAKWGAEKSLQFLIQMNVNLNAVDHNGKTALMLAVEGGNVVIAKTLVQAGADISLRDHENKRALDYAQTSSNTPTMEN